MKNILFTAGTMLAAGAFMALLSYNGYKERESLRAQIDAYSRMTCVEVVPTNEVVR